MYYESGIVVVPVIAPLPLSSGVPIILASHSSRNDPCSKSGVPPSWHVLCLRFRTVGSCDVFVFPFPLSRQKTLRSTAGPMPPAGTNHRLFPFLFFLSFFFSVFFLFFFLFFTPPLVASTAHCCATEAESAFGAKGARRDLCPLRMASPPLSVLWPRSSKCLRQITPHPHNHRRNRALHHRHCMRCPPWLSSAFVSCEWWWWHSCRQCSDRGHPPGYGMKGAGAS